MRRLVAVIGPIVLVILVAAAYQRLFGDETLAPRLVSSEPVAVIGSDSEAVAVAADGTLLLWLALPEETSLPSLPLESPPNRPRLQGPVLEQVRVLAAVPAVLQPYVERSFGGESGVDVELSSGIELRFGSAGQAARKWKAAAAVLADPEITALDYIVLYAPGRPSVGGSGHALPPLP